MVEVEERLKVGESYALHHARCQLVNQRIPNPVQNKDWVCLLDVLKTYRAAKARVPNDIWKRGLVYCETVMQHAVELHDLRDLNELHQKINCICLFLVDCSGTIPSSHDGYLPIQHIDIVLDTLRLTSEYLLRLLAFLFPEPLASDTKQFRCRLNVEDDLLCSIHRLSAVISLLCTLWVSHLPMIFSWWSTKRILKSVTDPLISLVLLPLAGYCEILLQCGSVSMHPKLICLRSLLDTVVKTETATLGCTAVLFTKGYSTSSETFVNNFLNDLKSQQALPFSECFWKKTLNDSKSQTLLATLHRISQLHKRFPHMHPIIQHVGYLHLLPHILSSIYVQENLCTPEGVLTDCVCGVLLNVDWIFKELRGNEMPEFVCAYCVKTMKQCLVLVKQFRVACATVDLLSLLKTMLTSVVLYCFQQIQQEATSMSLLVECWDCLLITLRLDIENLDAHMPRLLLCLSYEESLLGVHVNGEIRAGILARILEDLSRMADVLLFLDTVKAFFSRQEDGLSSFYLASAQVTQTLASLTATATSAQLPLFGNKLVELTTGCSDVNIQECSQGKNKEHHFYLCCILLGTFLRHYPLTEQHIVTALHLCRAVDELLDYSFAQLRRRVDVTSPSYPKTRTAFFGMSNNVLEELPLRAYVILLDGQLDMYRQLNSWMLPCGLPALPDNECVGVFGDEDVSHNVRVQLIKYATQHGAIFSQMVQATHNTSQKSIVPFPLSNKDDTGVTFIESSLAILHLYRLYPARFGVLEDYWRKETLKHLCSICVQLKKENAARYLPEIIPHGLTDYSSDKSPLTSKPLKRRRVDKTLLSLGHVCSTLLRVFVECVLRCLKKSMKSRLRTQPRVWFLGDLVDLLPAAQEMVERVVSRCAAHQQCVVIYQSSAMVTHDIQHLLDSAVHKEHELHHRQLKRLCYLYLFTLLLCRRVSSHVELDLDTLGKTIHLVALLVKRHPHVFASSTRDRVPHNLEHYVVSILYCAFNLVLDLKQESYVTDLFSPFQTLATALCERLSQINIQDANQTQHFWTILALLRVIIYSIAHHVEVGSFSDTIQRTTALNALNVLCFPILELRYQKEEEVSSSTQDHGMPQLCATLTLHFDAKRSLASSCVWIPIFCSFVCLSLLSPATLRPSIDWESVKCVCCGNQWSQMHNGLHAMPLKCTDKWLYRVHHLISSCTVFLVGKMLDSDVGSNTPPSSSTLVDIPLHKSSDVFCKEFVDLLIQHSQRWNRTVLTEDTIYRTYFFEHRVAVLSRIIRMSASMVGRGEGPTADKLESNHVFQDVIGVIYKEAKIEVLANFASLNAVSSGPLSMIDPSCGFFSSSRFSCSARFNHIDDLWILLLDSLKPPEKLHSVLQGLCLHYHRKEFLDPSLSHVQRRNDHFTTFLICIASLTKHRTVWYTLLGLHRYNKKRPKRFKLIPSRLTAFHSLRTIIHHTLLHLRYQFQQFKINLVTHYRSEPQLAYAYRDIMCESWIWIIQFSIVADIILVAHEVLKLAILEQENLDLWRYSFVTELLDLCWIGSCYLTEVCHLLEFITWGEEVSFVGLQSSRSKVTEYAKMLKNLLFFCDILGNTTCCCLQSCLLMRKDVASEGSLVVDFLYRLLNKRSTHIKSIFKQLMDVVETVPSAEFAGQLSRQMTRVWTSYYLYPGSMSVILRRDAVHIVQFILNMSVLHGTSTAVNRSLTFKNMLHTMLNVLYHNNSSSDDTYDTQPSVGLEEEKWNSVKSILLCDGLYPLLESIDTSMKQYLHAHLSSDLRDKFTKIYKEFQEFYSYRLTQKQRN